MIFRGVVHRMIVFRRVSRVVGQILNNQVSIFLRGYLVDLRGVFQESWVT